MVKKLDKYAPHDLSKSAQCFEDAASLKLKWSITWSNVDIWWEMHDLWKLWTIGVGIYQPETYQNTNRTNRRLGCPIVGPLFPYSMTYLKDSNN